MAHNVHAVTEVVGTSTESISDAIQGAIDTAGQTLRNLEWFEVTEIRGKIAGGKAAGYQVSMKLGFRYEK